MALTLQTAEKFDKESFNGDVDVEISADIAASSIPNSDSCMCYQLIACGF